MILGELIFFSQFGLLFRRYGGDIGLPAWTEIDVPAPETTDDRLGILVVVSPELAGLAGIACHRGRFEGFGQR